MDPKTAAHACAQTRQIATELWTEGGSAKMGSAPAATTSAAAAPSEERSPLQGGPLRETPWTERLKHFFTTPGEPEAPPSAAPGVPAERLQRLFQKLARVRSNLALFNDLLRADDTATSDSVLAELRPGLSDAVSRIVNILAAGKLDSDDGEQGRARQQLLNLHAELTHALHVHEQRELQRRRAAASAGRPLPLQAPPPVMTPQDLEPPDPLPSTAGAAHAHTSAAASSAASASSWLPWRQSRRAPINPAPQLELASCSTAAGRTAAGCTAADCAAAAVVSSAPAAPSFFMHKPYFCWLAIAGCGLGLLLEFHANGWAAQVRTQRLYTSDWSMGVVTFSPLALCGRRSLLATALRSLRSLLPSIVAPTRPLFEPSCAGSRLLALRSEPSACLHTLTARRVRPIG